MDLADVWFHLSGSSAIKLVQNWHCFVLFVTIPYEEIQFRLSNNWLTILSVLHDKREGEGVSWVDEWIPNYYLIASFLVRPIPWPISSANREMNQSSSYLMTGCHCFIWEYSIPNVFYIIQLSNFRYADLICFLIQQWSPALRTPA